MSGFWSSDPGESNGKIKLTRHERMYVLGEHTCNNRLLWRVFCINVKLKFTVFTSIYTIYILCIVLRTLFSIPQISIYHCFIDKYIDTIENVKTA